MEGGEETALGAGSIARKNLQQRLLDAVKQCQIHFGARQEMATETDLRVGTLCVEWEAVLLHGMKRSRNKPPIKQFAGLVKTEVSLWQLAQLCLSPEEVQRFLRLKNVWNDIGRGRAWLRAAINERTLETYLHLILASSKLQSLYEPHAFLLDQELNSILPVMAAGLSSILFSIPVDSEYLNTPARNLDLSIMATPLSTTSSTTSSALLLDMQHNGHTEDGSVVRKKKKKKPYSLGHQPPVEQTIKLGGVADIGSGGVAFQQGGMASRDSSENLSSSPSIASVNSDLETTGIPRYVAFDTMLLGNHSSSEADAEAAANATAMVLSATNSSSSSPALHRPHPPPPPPPQASINSDPAVSQHGTHTLSPDELREALLVMVKTKDDLELANKQLDSQLQEVRLERDQLIMELNRTQTELTSIHSTHIQQQALERENDLLKEQMKLIVQRREPTLRPSDSSMESSIGSQPSSFVTLPTPSSPENKLSEMADMHGEILELNDRLQREMTHKESYITRLINTIQEAGLQVPTMKVSMATAGESDKNEFISVWIPSVIKRGRGPDTHHIYQVFVRIRDQEWNVYRRYAEFREFHKQLQQCIPEVANFQFPPKKALGNKNAHLVEERRHRLQDYLRVVMRLCTEPRIVQGKRRKHQLDPIMKNDIDRDTLQDILPFFREDMHSPTTTVAETHRLSYSGL